MQKPNHILYVDTSILGLNAAVYSYSKDTNTYKCLDHVRELDNERASSNIASVLDQLLSRNSLKLSNPDLGFGFAKGPGSFTGIKVGIATMLAIKFSRESANQDVFFAGFSAMQEIWRDTQNQKQFLQKKLEIILPASRNEFYSCYLDSSSNLLKEDVFDLRKPSEVKRWLSLETTKCFLVPWPEVEDFLKTNSQLCMVLPTEEWFMYTQTDSMLLSLLEAKWRSYVEEANFLRDASPIQNRKLFP